MTESNEVKVRKRRSSREIERLVREFETSGLRQGKFCQKHGMALSTLQRRLRTRRIEEDRPSQGKGLIEVKVVGTQGSGAESSALELVLAWGRRIEVRRNFDAETLTRLIRIIEEI
jgi:hypothetical protein